MAFPSLDVDVAWPMLPAIGTIVLLAYVVFGATGFGSSIVAVPALAHVFPLTFAVPLVTSLDVVAASTTSVRQWRLASFSEIRRMLPWMLAGIATGATALVNLPRGYALLALGLFVAGYGAYALAGPRSLRRAPGWLAVPVAFVGGVFSVMFGTGGPIYMAFLAARVHDKSALRATSALLVTISVWMRVIVFLVTGLLQQSGLLVLAASLLPPMALGLVIGNRLHHALSRGGVMRLIAALLVANGVLLVLRAAELLRGG